MRELYTEVLTRLLTALEEDDGSAHPAVVLDIASQTPLNGDVTDNDDTVDSWPPWPWPPPETASACLICGPRSHAAFARRRREATSGLKLARADSRSVHGTSCHRCHALASDAASLFDWGPGFCVVLGRGWIGACGPDGLGCFGKHHGLLQKRQVAC